MKDIRFSWDERKAAQNVRKHGVSFEEAMTVFFDERATEFFDPDHSADEDRFLMLGISSRLRRLVVHYAVRANGTRIRIISARKPTKNESKRYTREEP
ncbi:MAG: BrnT family toxin [Sedimentisphaerales bacterium]|nr:BrnT family toxin [Sedimentisphaerales bacterium]